MDRQQLKPGDLVSSGGASGRVIGIEQVAWYNAAGSRLVREEIYVRWGDPVLEAVE